MVVAGQFPRYHARVRFPLRLAGVAAAALVTSAAPTAQPTSGQPQFRTGTNVVVVPVVVVDGKGNDVTTLSLADFQVFEDGQRVVVETFVPPGDDEAETGRFVVVVVDNLHVAAENFWRVKSLAGKIADKVGPADRVGIIALAGGRAADTSSKAQLQEQIQRIQPSAGAEVHEAGTNATVGLETLAGLAEQIVKSPHRRKVMVLIGSPGLFSPSEPSAFEDREPNVSPIWMKAVQRLGAANVALHVIDPNGFQGRAEDYGTSFATATGGAAWANTNNYDRAIDRMWRDAGTYYLLGYRAPVDDGRAHAISVRVNVPGVTVRARRIRG